MSERRKGKVQGFAIRTGFYFHDEATGRQMPFLACSEDQNGGGWWVDEAELAAGTVECPHTYSLEGAPHRLHRVVSFEEVFGSGS